jgi:hypothetical protein
MRRLATVFLILICGVCCSGWFPHGTSLINPQYRSLIDVGDYYDFPFVNFFKMAFNGPSTGANITANQYYVGTPSANIGYSVVLPPTYLGTYTIAITGSETGSGLHGFQFQGAAATVYSIASGGVNGCSSPPCFVSNNLTVQGTNPTVVFDFSTPVTGAANNGSGLIRLTAANANLSNGQTVTVANVVGSDGNGCGANGIWTIANRTSTTIDLTGSSFPGGCTYTSGGQIFPFTSSSQPQETFTLLSTTTYTGVTNIVMCKTADYNVDNTCNTTAGHAAWAGGFNNDFVQTLAALKPGVIRYLDYNNAIFGNPPDYANWATENYFSYWLQNNTFLPGRWFGSSTGTNATAISCTGNCTYLLTSGAPVDGDFVDFLNTNVNTTSAVTLTLTDANNVTSSAIPVLNPAGNQISVTVGGTPTQGDTLSLTFTSSCLSGGSHTTAAYTVGASDSIDNIANQLVAIVQADSTVQAQPLDVTGNSPIGGGWFYMGYAVNACALTVTTNITGSATESVSIGSYRIGTLEAAERYHAVYSAYLQAWVAYTGGIGAAWPWSLMVKLSNAVSTASGLPVGCWLEPNLLWSNASFQSLATYAAANPCNTGGTWFEVSDEVWNYDNDETGQAADLANALGMGQDFAAYLGLKIRQFGAIARTAFSGSPSSLRFVYAFQLTSPTTDVTAGTHLCGSSCGNTAYQNAVGTDYNSGADQPHNFITTLSEAPYYSGGNLANNYGGWFASTWSATSATVSGNVLTVAGTVTGTIEPNQGIAGCDGTFITTGSFTSFPAAQLTGTVTTTLNGATTKNQLTWTLTSVAGLSPGMWVYNATNKMVSSYIVSVNSGTNQISIHNFSFASQGAHDTLIFGGQAGTYQLNNTSCSIASGTITGGDVLGLQYAADNYNGVNGNLGSQQDALNWAFFDILTGTRGPYLNGTTTVQSMLDPVIIANNFGGYGLPVYDYEGGLQASFPSTAQATSIGLPSSAYGGSTGYVNLLLIAFKNNALMQTLETYRNTLEVTNEPAGSASGYFTLESGLPWGLLPNTLYSTPFKTYNAIQNYNFLLKRDLDPASNDNSPAFMASAA